ncbi:MAG: hypothetical protein HRU20_01795 [Pseudomonadales bacterium]|nr:hypothetical protein [Pseudomonadales bacterium]
MKFLSVIAGCLLLLFYSISLSAEVVVVVNPDNHNQLTQTQIRHIFLGKALTFPNGDKVQMYDLPQGDKNRDDFRNKLLRKSETRLSSYWARMLFSSRAKPPRQLDDAAAIKRIISQNPNAIAYINEDDVDAQVRVVMAVK